MTIETDGWRELRNHRPLVAVVDLDRGAFAVPARVPRFSEPDLELFRELQRTHVQVVLVSGLARAKLDPLRERLPGAWWFIEHGAARFAHGHWTGQPARRELDSLASRLAPVVDHGGVEVQRTSVSLRVTWGPSVSEDDTRIGATVFATWLLDHPTFRLIASDGTLEVRLGAAHKSSVLPWIRQRLPGARCVVSGFHEPDHLDRGDVRTTDETARATLASLAALRAIEYPAAASPAPAHRPSAPALRVVRRR